MKMLRFKKAVVAMLFSAVAAFAVLACVYGIFYGYLRWKGL